MSLQNAIHNNTKQTSFFSGFFREIAHYKYNQKFGSFQLWIAVYKILFVQFRKQAFVEITVFIVNWQLLYELF